MGMVLISGALALVCSVQEVTPLTGNASGDTYALTVSVRDGKGMMSGAAQLDGQNRIEILRADDGSLLLKGLTFRNRKEEAWAVLNGSSSADNYEMEWLMYDHVAHDGRGTAAVWAKGRCKSVGQTKEIIQ